MKLRILKNEHLLFCQNWQLDQIHSFLHRKNTMASLSFPTVCLLVLAGCAAYVTANGYGQSAYSYARPQIYAPPGPPLDTLVPESEVDSQGVWDLTVTSVGYSQSFSSVSSRLKLITINKFIF